MAGLSPNPGGRATTQIWLLMLLALTAGTTLIAWNTATLAQLREDRRHAGRRRRMAEHRLLDAASSLARSRAYVIDDLVEGEGVSKEGRSWLERTQSALDEQRANAANDRSLILVQGVSRELRAVGDDQSRMESLVNRRLSARAELMKATKRARATIRAWQGLVDSANGRHRLDCLRWFQELQEERDRQQPQWIPAIDALIEARRWNGDLPIRAELADLALRVERLISAEDADALPHIKDNQLDSSLKRLRRACDRIAARQQSDAEHVPAAAHYAALDAIENALFGGHFVRDDAHQTVHATEFGLYGRQLNAISIDDELGAARQRAEAQFSRVTAALDELRANVIESAYQVSKRAETLLVRTSLGLLAGGIVAALALVLLTRRVTTALKLQIQTIAKTNEELDARTQQLAREIEESELARLERDRLLESSHRAGMAEVATGVLHNVGNVLNSINVVLTDLGTRLSSNRILTLREVIGMVTREGNNAARYLTDDPKGKAIPKYLERCSAAILRDRSRCLEHIDTLVNNVEHIKNIIKTQQATAKNRPVVEAGQLADVVTESLRICNVQLTDAGIDIVCEHEDSPPLGLDRHRVVMILVNLLKNAKDAILEAAVERGSIRIATETLEQGHYAIEITDNGTGLPPGDPAAIFRHGFTTKKNGHGFGLHSCANAAREMGGDLIARNADPQPGATFTLCLEPLEALGYATHDDVTTERSTAKNTFSMNLEVSR